MLFPHKGDLHLESTYLTRRSQSQRYIAETGSFALGRLIPGVNHLYGGTTFNYHDVVRADDSFKIHDDYLGVIEKHLKGKNYRLLIMTCKRSYINREDRIICEALG